MAKLNHPNIVSFHRFIETDKRCFVIMEYSSGMNLKEYLRINKPISEKTARTLIKGVAEAICYCHCNNIVHRDIKLENILVSQDLSVKLIDFGFSCVMKYSNENLHSFCG
jgi:serine/threonine protein kinase